MSLADAIKHEARSLGFDAVGIARVEDGTARRGVHESGATADPSSHPPAAARTSLVELFHARLSEWLRRGYHGAMDWMGREPARRADPRRVLTGCRSVIVVGMNYYTEQRADERPGHGRIARYAWGADYHDVLRARLEELERWIARLAPDAATRSYVDTGPVMEKAWAQQAGLGWIGKHSNLVSASYGSWLLLGEILTTLELDPDEPATDLCGSCTLCLKACPTGAIAEPYVVDARRCISYLTIELHQPGDQIPAELAPQLGNRIFGCDDCLDICPYNVHAIPTSEPAFQPTPMVLAPNLERLAALTPPDFAAAFRRSPIRRAKHGGFLRNVRLALRNTRGAATEASAAAKP